MQKAKQTVKATKTTEKFRILPAIPLHYLISTAPSGTWNIHKTTKTEFSKKQNRKKTRKSKYIKCARRKANKSTFFHTRFHILFYDTAATASVQFWCFICFHFYRSPYSFCFFFLFCFIADIKKVFQYLTLAICTQQQASSKTTTTTTAKLNIQFKILFSHFFSITE